MTIKEIARHLADRLLDSQNAKKHYDEDGEFTTAIQAGNDLIMISIIRGAGSCSPRS